MARFGLGSPRYAASGYAEHHIRCLFLTIAVMGSSVSLEIIMWDLGVAVGRVRPYR